MGRDSKKANERHEEILRVLNHREMVTITEFREMFQCSEATIRNDFTALEKKGMLIRVHGGVKNAISTPAITMEKRRVSYLDRKEKIARYVVENIIKERTAVILDAGTTTFEVAMQLAKEEIPITVLTNSLPIATVIASTSNIELLLFGGDYDKRRYACYNDHIGNVRADLFLMGINGINPDVGITIASKIEASTKLSFISRASRTIALGDSSKLGNNGLWVVDGLEKVKEVVTDCEADKGKVELFREKGVYVHLAD